jgi:hypothetical protein
MALQGDGNGIVTIPQATATGDFSLVFSSIVLTNGLEMIIGDNSASNDFIAIFSPSKIGARINGGNTTQTNTTLGQDVKYEILRVGGTVTVKVDDVVFSNHAFAGAFSLNTFFSYSSGSLKGAMLLSGTCTMTGFTGAGNRSYDLEGSGSTLVDTISGENGTLSGFTTGGFTAPTGNILITSVNDYDCIQRNGSNQANFTIAGTCSGTTSIEYSFDEVTWFTLDASPTTTFSGVVTVTGQQSVTVRDSTNNAITDKVLSLTASLTIACWWQSNMEGQITNNQTLTVTGVNPIPIMYKAGVFSQLSDPTSNEVGALGSLLPLLAQKYSDLGVAVCFLNLAKGSTSIDYWNGNGTTGYGRLQSAYLDIGFEFTLSIGGETDTAAGMPQAEMETKLGNTVDSIFTDFGVKNYLVTFPFGNTTTGNPADMNAAFASTVSTNENCLFGGNLQVIDIDTGTTAGNDGTHIKSDADAITASNIIWDALTAVFSTFNMTATNTPDGSYSFDLYNDDTKALIETRSITFSGGAASEVVSVDVATSLLAFAKGGNPPITGMAYIGVTE